MANQVTINSKFAYNYIYYHKHGRQVFEKRENLDNKRAPIEGLFLGCSHIYACMHAYILTSLKLKPFTLLTCGSSTFRFKSSAARFNPLLMHQIVKYKREKEIFR